MGMLEASLVILSFQPPVSLLLVSLDSDSEFFPDRLDYQDVLLVRHSRTRVAAVNMGCRWSIISAYSLMSSGKSIQKSVATKLDLHLVCGYFGHRVDSAKVCRVCRRRLVLRGSIDDNGITAWSQLVRFDPCA